ncbi:hypothetical protein GCM10009830_01110 [Glycomyces endophyticus]|uniref:PH domain-containing protein n=1 Tax=Glycomyces endophyticus TaxID=480996 RepID=A0ABN2FUG4_9ACTN
MTPTPVPAEITIRYATWWIVGGAVLHVILAAASGLVMHADGVPIWFAGPVFFGLSGAVSTLIVATGAYPYVRVTHRQISYSVPYSSVRRRVALGPGDRVVANADGLYHWHWPGQWDTLAVSPSLANTKDWNTLRYWTTGPRPAAPVERRSDSRGTGSTV